MRHRSKLRPCSEEPLQSWCLGSVPETDTHLRLIQVPFIHVAYQLIGITDPDRLSKRCSQQEIHQSQRRCDRGACRS